jgi:hypothetical protein
MSWVEGNELLKGHVTFSILLGTDFTNKIDCACPFILPNVSVESNKKKEKLKVFGLSFVIEFAHSCAIYDIR